MIGEYSYIELKEKVKTNPTEENINNLVQWFQQYGNRYWTGEAYNADEFELYPVKYGEEDEYKEIPVLKWGIR